MDIRINPSSDSDVIIAHYLGGWFEMDKELLSSVATLFKTVFTSNPNISRVMLPDTITLSVFVALRALFNGDEVDVPKYQLPVLTYQLASIGINTIRVYHKTLVLDEKPVVIIKPLSKVWRAVILWPRHDTDRMIWPKIMPYYGSYLPNDEPCVQFDLNDREDLLRSISYYNIKHIHGRLRNFIHCIGPNGSFRVRRRDMRKLSALKYKIFNEFAGDMNHVLMPAQFSEYTFDNFKLLMENRECEVDLNRFGDFKDQLMSFGVTIEIEGILSEDCTPRFRVMAKYDKESGKMVCKWNNEFELNLEDCNEKPAIEIRRLTGEEGENDQNDQSEEIRPMKRIRILI